MEQEDKSRNQTPFACNQSSTGTPPQSTVASQSGNSDTTSQSHRTPAATTASSAPSAQATSPLTTIGVTKFKRRRGLGIATPNACTACRKKRAKCDGTQPCSCCRAQKGVECFYEVPVRQSDENLRTENESLRSRQRSSDSVISALISPQLREGVLDRLRRGQTLEDIAIWLGGMLPSGGGIMPNLPRQGNSDIDSNPNMTSHFHSGAPPLEGMSAMGLGAVSNLAGPPRPQPPPTMRNDLGQGTPWLHAGISNSSRGSGAEPMNWQADLTGPPQSRIGFWGDNIARDLRWYLSERTASRHHFFDRANPQR